MGAHSITSARSTRRRVTAAGLLAAGAAVVGAGEAAAVPVTIDLPVQIPGVPSQITIDVPEGIQLPPGLVPAAAPAAAPVAFAAPAPSAGQSIVDAAASKIGSPYVWGATGPDAFDCSGLTSWAYRTAGISIPRTSQAQVSGGTPVAYADLRPGDVVAFYGGASHVGIYAGNGQVIHASTEGVPVGYAPLDSMPFYGAARYV